MPVKNYVTALNGLLPKDIRILDAQEKPNDFSSRFSATSRTYRYFICSEIPVANVAPYVWNIHHTPNIDNLNSMASILKGEIDCATFTASGDESLSTKRFLMKAHFFYDTLFPVGKVLVFEIQANAFLWKMVRSITGTLIEFDRNKKDINDFRECLESHERKNVGATAPANGLFLWDVSFEGKRVHV